MPGESITKPTTVQQFLKTRSGLRVEASAVDHFLTTVDELAGRVADKATELAKAEQRTTMLERDIIEGFKAVVGTPARWILRRSSVSSTRWTRILWPGSSTRSKRSMRIACVS